MYVVWMYAHAYSCTCTNVITLYSVLQVQATSQNFNGYTIGTLVVFGYSLLLASFVLFLVNEKETKVRIRVYIGCTYAAACLPRGTFMLLAVAMYYLLTALSALPDMFCECVAPTYVHVYMYIHVNISHIILTAF